MNKRLKRNLKSMKYKFLQNILKNLDVDPVARMETFRALKH